MAVHLVARAKEVIEGVVFTDSQLAIRALEGKKVGASPSLVAGASLAIRNARRGRRGFPSVSNGAHFVTRCRAFAAQRHQHLTCLGLEFLNLSFLFSSPAALASQSHKDTLLGHLPNLAKWRLQRLG